MTERLITTFLVSIVVATSIYVILAVYILPNFLEPYPQNLIFCDSCGFPTDSRVPIIIHRVDNCGNNEDITIMVCRRRCEALYSRKGGTK